MIVDTVAVESLSGDAVCYLVAAACSWVFFVIVLHQCNA